MTRACVLALLALAGWTPLFAQDDARVVRADLPLRLVPGQDWRGEVEMRNTGTQAWAHPQVKLGANDDQDPHRPGLEPRVWLRPGQVVPPGASVTFEVSGRAPAVPGVYRTDWRMVREGVRWFGQVALQDVVVVAPGGGVDDARVVSTTLPGALAPGERVRVTVTMQNTGTRAWAHPEVKLGANGDQDPLRPGLEPRVWLNPGEVVPPGGRRTFEVELLAPAASGAYLTDWRMVREGVHWFGQVAASIVRVGPAPGAGVDQAAALAIDFPASLAAGQRATGRVTFRNTGTAPWGPEVRLGAVGDQDPLRGGLGSRVYLPPGTNVPPGGQHTFQVELVAPGQPGTVLSDWQMVREGVHWFGQVALARVDVTPAPVRPRRSGRVRLQGRTLVDDQGPFNALGTSLFWAAWAWRHDRPKLERTLDWLSRHGFDYVRCLGLVGDPNGPDYWDGREIVWSWPDYRQVIEGVTDLAFDRYGLRVEWTLIGDGQVSIPDRNERYRLVDTFLALSQGREEKIIHFEIANEAWQNGFPGAGGQDELRALSRYMKDRTEILVAASAPDSHEPVEIERLYRGGVADLATIHFDRDVNKADGPWRPVRQPWEHQFLQDVPVGSNNEPIGPGASVAAENDPLRLVSAALVTHVAGLPLYVFHTRAGIRGLPADGELWDMPGADAFQAMKRYLPGDLTSWSPQNGHWVGAPFLPYARDGAGRLEPNTMWPDLGGGATGAVRVYSAVRGAEFVSVPFGIRGALLLEARRALELEVLEPISGAVRERRTLAAGERFELSGGEAFVIKGRFR